MYLFGFPILFQPSSWNFSAMYFPSDLMPSLNIVFVSYYINDLEKLRAAGWKNGAGWPLF